LQFFGLFLHVVWWLGNCISEDCAASPIWASTVTPHCASTQKTMNYIFPAMKIQSVTVLFEHKICWYLSESYTSRFMRIMFSVTVIFYFTLSAYCKIGIFKKYLFPYRIKVIMWNGALYIPKKSAAFSKITRCKCVRACMNLSSNSLVSSFMFWYILLSGTRILNKSIYHITNATKCWEDYTDAVVFFCH